MEDTMKLKVDEKGNAVVVDGKPVYVHDDGKEIPFDALSTIATIGRLNAEAKGHREAKEAAQEKLKLFEGIDDPEYARKAMQTVKNLDMKKLVDSGEVEKVKAEIAKSYQKELDEIKNKNKELETQLYAEKIGGAFARSQFIEEKLAIPADLVQARFGNLFAVENGKVVATDLNGNKIYSHARPGEFADFDEALETIIEQYPRKDEILKASNSKGGDAHKNKGTTGNSLKRSEMSTKDKSEYIRKHGQEAYLKLPK
jgi:hypothetical protein